MKLTTWNWSSHPYDKTRGVVIGPFFGVMCAISVPAAAGRGRMGLRFYRSGRMRRTVRHFAADFID